MPSHILTFKSDATDSEIQKVKEQITDGGGKIEHEYSLIKGFSFTHPEVGTLGLDNSPHIENIERDSEVNTQ